MLVVFGKRILDRIGTPAGASIAADIITYGGGASQASVNAIQTDLGDFSAGTNLQSALAVLGSLLDTANVPLGVAALFGLQVYKISAVTSDTSFTIAAAATGSPALIGSTNHYANQVIFKIGGSSAVGSAGFITASTGGGVLTLSGGGLANATVNDRVLIIQKPNQTGVYGDATTLTLPTVHSLLGAWTNASTGDGLTGSIYSKLRLLYGLTGSFDSNSNLTSVKAYLNHSGWENSGIGLGTAFAYGPMKVYTTGSSSNGQFTLTAVSGGAPVPVAADALRGGVVHCVSGAQAGKSALIHSYTTGAVLRHTLTGVSFGNGVYVVVEWPKRGTRQPLTVYPYTSTAVITTQATDTDDTDQEMAVAQTTSSATYVVLHKWTFTSSDAAAVIGWMRVQLKWSSDMSNAGTGATKWMISPESATETVNSAPSGSAVVISDEPAAGAAKTTHYLRRAGPITTAALPANGGFHLLLCGKGDGAETLTCTAFTSSNVTVG